MACEDSGLSLGLKPGVRIRHAIRTIPRKTIIRSGA